MKTGHAIPSQTDAGAHLNTNFCTAGESSYVLGEWVRERQLLSLEDAIRRFTFQPARIMGLNDRGLVREGMVADLMVFDLDRIGVKEDEITRDGPSGSPRRVQRRGRRRARDRGGRARVRSRPAHRRPSRPGAPGSAADLRARFDARPASSYPRVGPAPASAEAGDSTCRSGPRPPG